MRYVTYCATAFVLEYQNKFDFSVCKQKNRITTTFLEAENFENIAPTCLMNKIRLFLLYFLTDMQKIYSSEDIQNKTITIDHFYCLRYLHSHISL